MEVYYFLSFRIVRTCCVSLKLLYFSLLASKSQFLISSSAPLFTIGVGFELSWFSCQIYDGIEIVDNALYMLFIYMYIVLHVCT